MMIAENKDDELSKELKFEISNKLICPIIK